MELVGTTQEPKRNGSEGVEASALPITALSVKGSTWTLVEQVVGQI